MRVKPRFDLRDLLAKTRRLCDVTSQPEAAACGAVVRAASRIVSELNAVLKPFGLTEPSFNVLRILRGGPKRGLTCGQIGGLLVSRGPDVTRLVGRLEREGLVARRRNRDDRRVVLVTIRPAGTKLLTALDKPVAIVLASFWDGITDSERARIVKTLAQLTTRNDSQES